MGDFTKDPDHTETLPTLHGHRRAHSAQFTYTNSGTGALSIVTDGICPQRNAIRVDWMEIDISVSNASHDWLIDLAFPAGHEYENHDYLIDSWAGLASNSHRVLYGGLGGVVVPNGAILRLECTATVNLAEYKIHYLYEILK